MENCVMDRRRRWFEAKTFYNSENYLWIYTTLGKNISAWLQESSLKCSAALPKHALRRRFSTSHS